MNNMEEYIHNFETESEFNTYINSSAYTEPWVSAHITGGGVVNSSITVTYNLKELGEYLTFEIVSGGTLYWHTTSTAKTIDYRIEKGNWVTITSSQDNDGLGTLIGELSVGQKIEFRGKNINYQSNKIKATDGCFYYAYGNMMSLINYENFRTNKTFPNNGTFRSFFSDAIGLLSHPIKQLCLPATGMTSSGTYYTMFSGCINLKRAPELPATKLSGNCYYGMFSGCTSLEKAPELPATTLAGQCYFSMFQNCTSLTTAPELPATEFTAYRVYNQMFAGCTSLVNGPSVLPCSALTSQCYWNMFTGCINLKKAPELLPATILISACYKSMFYNCKNLEKAPELPATTLTNECYRQMFYGCSKLNYIKCLATDISASNCVNNWVYGVQTESGTFVKDSSMTVDVENANWPRGQHGIPNNWTVQDAN